MWKKNDARPAEKAPPRGLRQVLEPEDLLVAVWFLAVQKLVVERFGISPLTFTEPAAGYLPLGFWLLALSALFVIFTRGERDTSIDQAVMRRMLLVLPLYWLLSIVGVVVSLIRGGEKSMRDYGGDVAEWPMPAVPDWLRRLAATPLLLVGNSAFLQAALDVQNSLQVSWADRAITDLAGTVFLVALSFVLFVVAPRIAAGASGDWRIWLLRFVFYLGALLLGYQLDAGWL